MSQPVVYADFNNADLDGRLRLNTVGTVRDLSRLGVRLQDGLRLTLRDDELEADGEARFSADERLWVALIDWQQVRPRSAANPLSESPPPGVIALQVGPYR